MKIYKRLPYHVLKLIYIAPICVAVMVYLTHILIPYYWINFTLGFVAVLWISVYTIVYDNIRFELDEETGDFYYYKAGKLRRQLNLKSCRIGYRKKDRRAFWGDDFITLRIVDENAGNKKINIDAALIGKKRFDELFGEMGRFARQDPDMMVSNMEYAQEYTIQTDGADVIAEKMRQAEEEL